jgi:hypothetical protein
VNSRVAIGATLDTFTPPKTSKRPKNAQLIEDGAPPHRNVSHFYDHDPDALSQQFRGFAARGTPGSDGVTLHERSIFQGYFLHFICSFQPTRPARKAPNSFVM